MKFLTFNIFQLLLLLKIRMSFILLLVNICSYGKSENLLHIGNFYIFLQITVQEISIIYLYQNFTSF